MPFLQVRDLQIPYEIKHSVRARRLSMTIEEGGVKVTLPKRIKEKEALKFLNSKLDWIYKNYKKIQDNLEELGILDPKVNSCDRFSVVLYQGKNSQVLYEYVDGLKITEVKLVEGNFLVNMPKGTSEDEAEGLARLAIKFFIKDKMKKRLVELVKYYAEVVGVSYSEIKIKDLKGMWGSCNYKRVLTFNWQLAAVPEEVMEYVVLHEVCHLVHYNHSKEYWNLVASFMPDYKVKRAWLKKANTNILKL